MPSAPWRRDAQNAGLAIQALDQPRQRRQHDETKGQCGIVKCRMLMVMRDSHAGGREDDERNPKDPPVQSSVLAEWQ